MHRLEANIKMGLNEIGWNCVEWIHPVQERDQWWAVVNIYQNCNEPLASIKFWEFID
jgi:hypothetical protein